MRCECGRVTQQQQFAVAVSSSSDGRARKASTTPTPVNYAPLTPLLQSVLALSEQVWWGRG